MPGSFCEKSAWVLTNCKATGLGYYIQHSTRLLTGSDRSRTLTLPVFPEQRTASGLYEEWFEKPVMKLAIPPQNRLTAPGGGSLLRAH